MAGEEEGGEEAYEDGSVEDTFTLLKPVTSPEKMSFNDWYRCHRVNERAVVEPGMKGNTNRGPCRETYIGETERSLKTRFLEHRRPSSVASEVSQHIHIESPGHTVDLEGVRIMDTEQDYFKRGIKEAIYIRALQPSLNRDGGRYRLQTTFDPLLTSHVGKITCPQNLGQIAEEE
ncbi:hypothetical protein Bbelb_280430 [Branchiostoma belcheri]|nr:hypothetical protein Bbelb_280430 [Branchiostoma belcheri]